MVFKNWISCWFCIGILTFNAGFCFARYTVVLDADFGSEPSLYQVLDVVSPVSGGWSSTSALNSNVNGLRISDSADQIWQAGTYRVTVLSSSWGGVSTPSDTAGQYFQYAGPDGSNATALNSVSTPADTVSFTVNEPYVLSDGGGTFAGWSSESLNTGAFTDRMVTFDVTGLDVYAWVGGDINNPVTRLVASGQMPAYITGFEVGADGDYQDMLFLIQTVNTIPAPGAIVLSCSGLFIVGWLKQKRFIK